MKFIIEFVASVQKFFKFHSLRRHNTNDLLALLSLTLKDNIMMYLNEGDPNNNIFTLISDSHMYVPIHHSPWIF